jgi:predicted Zn-dependent peptidase
MAGFQRVDDGRIHVHVYATPRFKTRHFNVKFVQPLARDTVTPTALLPYLWMEGTQSYPTARAIMERADDLFGATVRTSIGKRGDRHVVEAYAGVPDEQAFRGATGLFQQAQALAAEVCSQPVLEGNAFPQRHVQREITLHKRRIESLFDDKIAWSMDRCLEAVYQGERFGLPRLGYVEDLGQLSGEQLRSVHHHLLNTADIHAYVVGNVGDADRAAQDVLTLLHAALERAGGGASGTDRTAAAEGPVNPLAHRSGDVRTVVDEQPVNQGKLNLGFRTGISCRDDDYPAMLVCNGILGGFPHSKLFVNVREKASLAYYASSRLDGLTGVLAVQTGIEINNYEQALSIIQEQVRAIQNGEISATELAYTKHGLRNQYLQANDQPMSLIDLNFAGVLAGQAQELEELLKRIEAVTADDVVRVSSNIQLDTVYFLRNEVSRGA